MSFSETWTRHFSTTDSDFNFAHATTPLLLGVPSTLRKIGLGSGARDELEQQNHELEAYFALGILGAGMG